MRFLSVCSGIEAASVAWNPIGWEAVAFSEIEKFPSAVLAHHYPDVPNLGDFTKIDTTTLGPVDILSGGTPCQAFSVAGLRNSLADARGNLSLEFVRLAHELAAGNGLRNVVWENVPGVLSTKDNAFGCFLGALVGADDALVPSPKPADGKSNQHWKWSRKSGSHAVKFPDAGMVDGPKGRAAWRTLDAQYFGLAQRRRRVIVVADFGIGADPASVLFERASLSGNTPPSRETGEDVAPTISARTKGGGGLGTDFDLDGGLVEYAIQAGALRENPDSGPDGVGVQSRIAYTLEARSEVQAVAYAPEIARCDATSEGSSQDYETTTMVAQAVCVTGDITHALKAEGADASEDGTGRGNPIIAFDTTQCDLKVALNAVSSPQGDNSVIHAFDARQTDVIQYGGISGPMDTKQPGPTALIKCAVRRLTPRECERLMGFPDDYTLIPYRKKQAADGPRYKALGNSWAVPKFAWLGRRIDRLMPVLADNDNATQELERQVSNVA